MRSETPSHEATAPSRCLGEQRPANSEQNGAQPDAPPVPLEFRAIYERYFHQVERWIRAMGGPDAERADLAQDVFVVVHRRLPDFVGDNVAGWLYQIARHRVRDFRRLSWVRHMLWRSVPLLGAVLEDDRASPAQSLETREKRQTLELLLTRLNESERAALVLFELDGYSGEEIAHIQGVSINTVWARIYKARGKLRTWLANTEKQSASVPPLTRIPEPRKSYSAPLRVTRKSA